MKESERNNRLETGTASGGPGLRDGAAGRSLGEVRLGLVVFYVAALALNAVWLHRNNERMPYGPLRTFWVAVSAPAAGWAQRAGLDRFRDGVAGTLGQALNR